MSENPKDNLDIEDDLSLESILAEYKGEAYIAGEKKRSKDDLDQQTDEILREVMGELGMELPSQPEQPLHEERSVPEPEPAVLAQPTIQLPVLPKIEVHAPTVEPETQEIPQKQVEHARHKLEAGEVIEIPMPPMREEPVVEAEKARTIADEIDLDQSAFIEPEIEMEAGAVPDPQPDVPPASITHDDWKAYAETEAETHIDPEARIDDEDEEEAGLLSRIRRKDKEEEPESDFQEEGEYDTEAFAEEELTLRQAAGLYGKGINRLQVRGMLTILLSLLMLLFTARGDAAASLPGVLNSTSGLIGALLIMQVLAMLLTAEVIATGFIDIVKRRPGVETLVTVAALASIGDAIHSLYMGADGRGLPYAAVVVFALGTALLGIKSVRNAMKTTLRTAATKKEPYVVASKYGAIDKDFILYKARLETDGFIRKTQQMDFSEYIYSLATPLLLLGSVVFALLAALGGMGNIWTAIHHFAGMTAVSASFTGLLAYGIPFSLLSRKLTKVGAALAGFGGAAEVSEATGVIITDNDVFPAGTLSLSGVKIIDKMNEEKVVTYSASIILASGCGLSEVFQDVLQKQKLSLLPVTDLACYEGGGIGAKVNGEEVIVGGASLMNLMGIRLPQNLNVKNAVFTAIGGELAGVFAINYTPLNSVKEALLSLLHSKIHPLFAVRDFNVTPIMLQTKFQITTDKIDFLTYEERYNLSDLEPDPQGKPFAVITREGLGPLADVIVGGKRLKNAVVRNTILSIASSVIGLCLLLSFFWTGAAETASATNLFYYQGAWLFVMYLLSRTVTLD